MCYRPGAPGPREHQIEEGLKRAYRAGGTGAHDDFAGGVMERVRSEPRVVRPAADAWLPMWRLAQVAAAAAVAVAAFGYVIFVRGAATVALLAEDPVGFASLVAGL
jgi:hypothetical protein